MNAGPGGFGHAPVSKGIVLATVGSSLVCSAARASHRRLPEPLAFISQALAFRSPGELLFGCLLLYYFRVLERQGGSAKFGSYAAVITGIAYGLQSGVSRLLQWHMPLPSGPLPLIFASFVPFLLDIPATSHFTVLGCRLSDKVFVYLAGLQLLLASGRRSLGIVATSLAAALFYKLNFCNVKKLRLPKPIAGLVSRFVAPFLSDPRSSGPTIILVGNNVAAGEGRGAGRGAHGSLQAGLHPGRNNGASSANARGQGPTQPSAAAAAAAAALSEPSSEAMEALLAMGFTPERARQAMQESGNDLQTAIALLVG